MTVKEIPSLETIVTLGTGKTSEEKYVCKVCILIMYTKLELISIKISESMEYLTYYFRISCEKLFQFLKYVDSLIITTILSRKVSSYLIYPPFKAQAALLLSNQRLIPVLHFTGTRCSS